MHAQCTEGLHLQCFSFQSHTMICPCADSLFLKLKSGEADSKSQAWAVILKDRPLGNGSNKR